MTSRVARTSAVLMACVVLVFTAACGPRSGQQPAPQATPAAAQPPSTPAAPAPATPVAPAAPAAPASPAATAAPIAPATPAVPASPAAPAVPVSNLKLTATTPTQIPPGGRVTFNLTFTLEGAQPQPVDVNIAFRLRGQVYFGNYGTINAMPGPNSNQDLSLTVHPSESPGVTVEVFGVVRAAGQVYFGQEAVVLTVTEPAQAAPTPQPGTPPAAAPVPAPTNAPPASAPQPPGGQPVAPPAPAVPAPPGPQVDPRSAAVKASLEQAGLKVLEVTFTPESSGRPAVLSAFVEANYAQPSGQAFLGLAFKILDVLYQHLTQYMTIDSQEKLKTVLVTGQQWTKYMLLFAADVEHIAILVKSLQASPDETTRNQAIQTFLQSARFRVFDIERQQYVDEKDFINKNFTGG